MHNCIKKLLLILILGLWAVSSQAQYTFNKRETLHSLSSILTSVLQKNGKYYCSGICRDSSNYIGNNQSYSVWGVKFAVFDELGNILVDTVYQKPSWSLGINVARNIYPWVTKMVALADGKFLLISDDIDSTHCHVLIMKFDSLGEVVYEKEIDKPVCAGINNDYWRMVDFKHDGTGNWLLLSTIYCPPQSDFFLMKLDTSFNLLWYKQFGDNQLDDNAGKLLITSNGYLLAGGRTNDNFANKNFIYRAELIHVDTAGNMQWQWLSATTRLTNAITDIIKTQDGGYLYCSEGSGKELPSSPVEGLMVWKGWVEKLDANRTSVWNLTLGQDFSNVGYNEPRVLKSLNNGNILLAGRVWGGISVSDTQQRSFATLVRIDQQGNVVWSKKHSSPQIDTFNDVIYDMRQTTDNGFIFCGEATDNIFYPSVAPHQRAWLVKVDSNGCLFNDPQCWPTVVPGSPENTAIIKVYPNPAHDYLQVETSLKDAVIVLMDITGRTLIHQTLSASSRIDLHNFTAGMYLYRVFSKGIIQTQGKFVKE